MVPDRTEIDAHEWRAVSFFFHTAGLRVHLLQRGCANLCPRPQHVKCELIS